MADHKSERREYNNPSADAFEAELNQLDPNVFPSIVSFGQSELYKIRGGVSETIDLVDNKRIKVRVKVSLPSSDDGQVNYVGKLLGPRGQTFKNIQESTHTRMAILGKGSMRNEQKERELLESGEQKFQHLKQKLHMQIDCFAPPLDAYYNICTTTCAHQEPDHSQAAGAQMGGQGGYQGMAPMRGRGGVMSPMMGRGGGPRMARGGRGAAAMGHVMGMNGNQAMQMSMAPQMNASMPQQMMPQPPMATGYEDESCYAAPDEALTFGGDYGQNDSWGKMNLATTRGHGRGRGRGGHPYVRRGGMA